MAQKTEITNHTMSFSPHILSPLPPPTLTKHPSNSHIPQTLPKPTNTHQQFTPKLVINKLLSISLALTLSSPLPSIAIPSLNSPPTLQTTPFAQSKNLPIGLENGKIRACPSINPGCVTTNPQSSSFAFPWVIPENSPGNAIEKLREAVLETQKNAKIQAIEEIPDGQYLQAEVDGGFGRDVLEFVVKGDVVAYRCMATKVTYIYPFTTALGDSKGQEKRMESIREHLGWLAPSFESMF